VAARYLGSLGAGGRLVRRLPAHRRFPSVRRPPGRPGPRPPSPSPVCHRPDVLPHISGPESPAPQAIRADWTLTARCPSRAGRNFRAVWPALAMRPGCHARTAVRDNDPERLTRCVPPRAVRPAAPLRPAGLVDLHGPRGCMHAEAGRRSAPAARSNTGWPERRRRQPRGGGRHAAVADPRLWPECGADGWRRPTVSAAP
jgi:hypothetical protein